MQKILDGGELVMEKAPGLGYSEAELMKITVAMEIGRAPMELKRIKSMLRRHGNVFKTFASHLPASFAALHEREGVTARCIPWNRLQGLLTSTTVQHQEILPPVFVEEIRDGVQSMLDDYHASKEPPYLSHDDRWYDEFLDFLGTGESAKRQFVSDAPSSGPGETATTQGEAKEDGDEGDWGSLTSQMKISGEEFLTVLQAAGLKAKASKPTEGADADIILMASYVSRVSTLCPLPPMSFVMGSDFNETLPLIPAWFLLWVQPANLGGLARTCEIFGVGAMTMHDMAVKASDGVNSSACYSSNSNCGLCIPRVGVHRRTPCSRVCQ